MSVFGLTNDIHTDLSQATHTRDKCLALKHVISIPLATQAAAWHLDAPGRYAPTSGHGPAVFLFRASSFQLGPTPRHHQALSGMPPQVGQGHRLARKRKKNTCGSTFDSKNPHLPVARDVLQDLRVRFGSSSRWGGLEGLPFFLPCHSGLPSLRRIRATHQVEGPSYTSSPLTLCFDSRFWTG